MTKNVLLVGGPRNGERIDVPASVLSIVVDSRDDSVATYRQRMLLVPVRTNGSEDRRRIFYFADDTLDDDEAFQSLLDLIDERR